MALPGMNLNPGVPKPNQQQQAQAPAQSGTPWYYDPKIYQRDQNFDADEYHAALLGRYLSGEGGLKGDARAYAGSTNTDVVRSAVTNLRARAANRRGINASIAGMPDELAQEEKLLNQQAGQALDQGLSGTRKNYNRRGLLYSGLREGSEQGVRQSVANQLGSSIMQARQSSNDLMNKRKQAVASLGLASEKEALAAAEQQFQVNLQSSVARGQALQQLGYGLGQAGAAAYSGMQSDEPRGGGGGYGDRTSGQGSNRRLVP